MNNIYDNGKQFLGTLQDVINYIKEHGYENTEDGRHLLTTLIDMTHLPLQTIICIDYDDDMNLTITHWKPSDVTTSNPIGIYNIENA